MSVHDLYTGKQTGRIAEGSIGTFAQTTGRREHTEFFYKLTGFNNPGIIYRYSFAEGAKQEKLFRSTEVKGLQPSEFTTEQVFVESTGGVKVPMFITTPAGVAKDGTAGALLYAYGGFSIPLDPFFSPAMLTFCKYYGCSFAVVNARGGGE
jgi:prolyl oligopeptidase